jgi:hypothetical protein
MEPLKNKIKINNNNNNNNIMKESGIWEKEEKLSDFLEKNKM